MTEVNGHEDSLQLRAARLWVKEKARLRTMIDDPMKGPAARLAMKLWQPVMEYMISEKEKGSRPDLMANAVGQFFGQAIFQLAMETNIREEMCRIAINTAMAKIEACFRAADKPSLILPAKQPGLVVARQVVDPKKVRND